LTQQGRKLCISQAYESNFGLLWPWPLTSWPPKLTVSCPCPVDHLCQIAAKPVHSFIRYRVHKTDDERTDGPVENITPPVSVGHSPARTIPPPFYIGWDIFPLPPPPCAYLYKAIYRNWKLVLTRICDPNRPTTWGPDHNPNPSALAVFSRNALYKSTFYLLFLLTYLLTDPRGWELSENWH